MPRDFISEFENENRRNLNENTLVRHHDQEGDHTDDANEKDDVPLRAEEAVNGDNTPGAKSSPKENLGTPGSAISSKKSKKKSSVSLPDSFQQSLEASHASSWWKRTTVFAQSHERELKIGVFAIVMVIGLILLASVATQSGQVTPAAMPRLLLFLVDGVTVDDFKIAAASRRIPSMNFYAQQSENCRPLTAANGDFNYFSNPFDRCVMSDPDSHTGTIFSLLTGAAFSTTTISDPSVGLQMSDVMGTNFTSFLKIAADRGLSTAVLGSSPLITVAEAPSATTDNSSQLCGILDAECAYISSPSTATSSSAPSCQIPASVGGSSPLSSMISSSKSCNMAFESQILDTDSPNQIWSRVKHVLRADADVVVVQIPQGTVNSWQESHKILAGSSVSSSSSSFYANAVAINQEFSPDAALYDVDTVFSKILRDVAVRSAEQGEEWLTFLGVSSADMNQPQLLLASNIITNGVRQDVDALLDSSMSQMTPRILSSIIADWLTRS